MMIDEAGTISSTVVGHFKLCVGILLGWLFSGKSLSDESLLGLVLVIGGIVLFVFLRKLASSCN